MIMASPTNESITDAFAAERFAFDDQTTQDDYVSLEDAIAFVSQRVAPVWPLKDYVAATPYAGFANLPFLIADQQLQSVSTCQLLPSIQELAKSFTAGRFNVHDIELALEAWVFQSTSQPTLFLDTGDITVDDIVHFLQSHLSAKANAAANLDALRTYTSWFDFANSTNWSSLFLDEIGKHCAAHYEEGQSLWPSPWKHLSLIDAWKSAAALDYSMDCHGLVGFRRSISDLPHSSRQMVAQSLHLLGVPVQLWPHYLHCLVLSMPGWFAWTKYQTDYSPVADIAGTDFEDLLAIALTYESNLAQSSGFSVDWRAYCREHGIRSESTIRLPRDQCMRMILLRAHELSFERGLLQSMTPEIAHVPAVCENQIRSRKLAQVVCCIDVRSERIRRNLEASSAAIETFGFAGFFGVPIEHLEVGQDFGVSQVPVLIKPQFQVREGFRQQPYSLTQEAISESAVSNYSAAIWKQFQVSATSCFSFVESMGGVFGWKSFTSTQQFLRSFHRSVLNWFAPRSAPQLGPTLCGLAEQGFDSLQQAALAEAVLRNIGLIDDFSRLVVLCGHASQTVNNPLAAGLDCGACGGHSGKPNARFAAFLLNQPFVRKHLALQGIHIPEDTLFIAAVHNTTSDDIEFCDLHELPASHQGDLEQLSRCVRFASQQTRQERSISLSATHGDNLLQRCIDWSEVRNEWGLAGNAAFVAGPRAMTRGIHLDGQVFLHSYAHENDPLGATLELITTAPLIVAHWINMQYYASTVDPAHFGSGTKTLHNPVGNFGILSGNGGDLCTGLPLESLHDGKQFRHQPLRLLAVIAAPRAKVIPIVRKHAMLESLLTNQWMHMVVVDDGKFYRYQGNNIWQWIQRPAEGVCC
jgi:uncharacterized protein YbcC (UPF0753/DUF2309 family)